MAILVSPTASAQSPAIRWEPVEGVLAGGPGLDVAGATVAYPAVDCPVPDRAPLSAAPGPSLRPVVVPAAADPAPLGGRWSALPTSPFSSLSGAGVWTGSRVIVVGAEERRTASYDPVRRPWRELARPSARLGPDTVAAWTGTEVVVVGSGPRSVVALAYDPRRDRWRRLPDGPSTLQVGTVAMLDGRLVIAAREGRAPGAVAILDPAHGCWRTTDPLPEGMDERAVMAGATSVIAVGSPWPHGGPRTVARLDLGSGTWSVPLAVPVDTPVGSAVWLGEDRFLFAGEGEGGRDAAILDVPTSTWTQLTDLRCASITFGTTSWTGRVALGVSLAFDPASDQCLVVPDAHDRNRRDPVEVWTGRELMVWTGGGGEELPALPDGRVYRPPAWVRR